MFLTNRKIKNKQKIPTTDHNPKQVFPTQDEMCDFLPFEKIKQNFSSQNILKPQSQQHI